MLFKNDILKIIAVEYAWNEASQMKKTKNKKGH